MARINAKDQRIAELEKRVTTLSVVCKLLAKLSASGPAFNNPIEIAVAVRVRDMILAECGIGPDGSPIGKQ